jgi:predicted dienelactone hydrolase
VASILSHDNSQRTIRMKPISTAAITVFSWLSFFAQAIGAVETQDITLVDEKRDKRLECRVYFPKQGGDLPLIVFSHGFGGDKTAFAAISQHIAESGYVLVHPSHTDGFGRSGTRLGNGGLRGIRSGGGLAGLLDDPAKIEGRVGDVLCVIDNIEQLYEKIPVLSGRIDNKRIGVGGHSYGAYTSMLLGGVTVDLDGAKARSFGDQRVRCIMPISGQGTGQQGLTEKSWANLKLPMLTMTGSKDQGATGQGPDWKKEPFKFSPTGDKYLVYIEGANHFSFGGLGLRQTDVARAVKTTSLAFWNAYLKDDQQAKSALQSSEIANGLGGVTITHK